MTTPDPVTEPPPETSNPPVTENPPPTSGPSEAPPPITIPPPVTSDPGPPVVILPDDNRPSAPHPGLPGRSGVTIVGSVRGSDLFAVPTAGSIAVMRRTVGCRIVSLCGLVSLATTASASRLLFQTPMGLDRGARPGGGSGSTGGGEPRKSPLPPAPDRDPHGPGAPGGALTGFSTSGGFQGGALLAIMLALLWLAPPQRRLRVAAFTPRTKSLSLVLSLERPG